MALFPGGKVGRPDVLWFYLISAIPFFLPVSTNSKSMFLPDTRSPLGLCQSVLFVSFAAKPENFMICKWGMVLGLQDGPPAEF